MRFQIKHEIRGRMRVHALGHSMKSREADILYVYLNTNQMVTSVTVYERTSDVAVCYSCRREEIIDLLRHFNADTISVPDELIENNGRRVNDEYTEKLMMKVITRYAKKWFLPASVRAVLVTVKSIKYMWKGLKCLGRLKLEVPVLDATAVGVSVLRRDYTTAGSVMFLLEIGELLEEWTHKKSVDDLARSMSLKVDKVWQIVDSTEVLTDASSIKVGDVVCVHMGSMIPFDGTVADGEAMVNQSTMTGESEPVHKECGDTVYAGTVIEEGELHVRVVKTTGSGRFDQIVKMIEETEKLKSGVEGRAEHIADRLVPVSLGATLLTYLITRNTTKALSILMVDFCCAIKLTTPVSVLSAIRDAGEHGITVKGGKFLEAVADATTVVFDKTGTLTKATPKVVKVISFNGDSEDELLRLAACLEEHFPHSMATAVVEAARERGLEHEEKHSKVEYVVAHGIVSSIDGKKVIIGSNHYVFEDEHCTVPEELYHTYKHVPKQYSHLYMAIDGVLAAVICIEDPLRDEATEIVDRLHNLGFKRVVMMTGDSDRAAKAIAAKVGVDEYYSEVLPEDKAKFVAAEKEKGNVVIMVGDGVNDSPALSAADAGIAISAGAQIAREIADITISANDLNELVTLRELSAGLMARIHKNYRNIVIFNTGLIALGVGGIIAPTTSALLHNTSTLYFGLKSMKKLI